MPNFNSPEGDLTDIFISDVEIFEQHIGNQLWNWGNNSYGQLGDNTASQRQSPVQTVSATFNWKQVSSGIASHTAAIKTDGTLWLWGKNNVGQLGNNGYANRSSPVQTVSATTDWKQVSAGHNYTACVKTDGTLWTWGLNSYGQLGNNDTGNYSSPVQITGGGTTWKQVDGGHGNTAAIKTDGTLWTWGRNNYGQLGNDSTTNRSSPGQTISAGTNWKQVSAGGYFTAAIKTDGTLWLWGQNSYGRLGDNSRTHRSSPVQTVSGGTNWKQVSGGTQHTACIKTDGTLWAWGKNYSDGRLGDNTTVHKSSPVQTRAGGTNWKQVSAGYLHTAAVTFIES